MTTPKLDPEALASDMRQAADLHEADAMRPVTPFDARRWADALDSFVGLSVSLTEEEIEAALNRMGREYARRRQERLNADGHWEGRTEPLDPALAWGVAAEDWRDMIREDEMRPLLRAALASSGEEGNGKAA